MKFRFCSFEFATMVLTAFIGCVCGGREADGAIPEGTITVRLEEFSSGFAGDIGSVDQLSAIDMSPLGDGRQLVFTLGGLVRLVQTDGSVESGAFLNTNNSTSIGASAGIGPTSLAVHPNFLSSDLPGRGKFYTRTNEVTGTAPADFGTGVNHQNVIYEWSLTDLSATSLELGADPDVFEAGDNAVRREVVRIQQEGSIHNVADISFDSNGYLYLASGDGGGNPNFAQDTTGPLGVFGSVLRIDPIEPSQNPTSTDPVSANGSYRINPNNFFSADGNPATLGEIFAYGFRSNFRINVDADTDEVWLGDVGSGGGNAREEVNRVVNGGNYGWPNREGTAGGQPLGGSIDPIFELFHFDGSESESTLVVGGFVYRGTEIPALTGKYVFADFGEDNGGQSTNVVDLYYGDPATDATSSRDDFFRLRISLDGEPLPERIWSIAQDENNELYLLGGPDRFNFNNGTDSTLLKLVAPPDLLNGVAGDVNQDGVVNSMDLDAMKSSWYSTGHATDFDRFTNGDLNLDGITNLNDLYLLHEALLDSGQLISESNSVPEPATGYLLAVVGLLWARVRRNRQAIHT